MKTRITVKKAGATDYTIAPYTKLNINGDFYNAIQKLADYENIGTVEEFKELKAGATINDKRCDICGRLVEEWHRYDYDGNPICDNCCINLMQGEIEELKEQLENSIKLPCKVGDTVYWKNDRSDTGVQEFKVMGFKYTTSDGLRICIGGMEPIIACFLGNNLFFTKPKAEARLKELEAEDEHC